MEVYGAMSVQVSYCNLHALPQEVRGEYDALGRFAGVSEKAALQISRYNYYTMQIHTTISE